MKFYRLFLVANQKSRKAIDNVSVNLNKIASFPLILSILGVLLL